MIKNERQYRITRAQADSFEDALAKLAGPEQEDSTLHPLLRKAEEDALRSQLTDLKAQLEDYEALRSGERKVLQVGSLAELPRALIQARIAAGLTQKQLAARLGVAEQQIQHYESTDYASASISRIQEVSGALGFQVRLDISFASHQ